MKAKQQSVGRATPLPWIGEEVSQFEAYLRAEKRSENTVQQYGDTLKGFLSWCKKQPERLTKADLQNWKGHLATELGYTENTMSTRIAAVNQYLERILERPDLKMRPPRRVFRTKIPLTEDEISRMLAEARKPREGRAGFPNNSDMSLRDYAAICLMYYGGLRASEITSLRLTDLDLDNRKVRVHEGKGNDFSLVNLSEKAVQGLREYLERGRPKPSEPEYADRVFLSIEGNPFARNRLWKMVKQVAFWTGIEKAVHPHIFRHSMITHMAEKGLSAPFIQAQSRHKSLDMVQRYTHLSEKSVRTAYDEFTGEEKPSEKRTRAQKQRDASEEGKSERGGMKDRILNAVLEGKLSLEDVGKIGKLLSDLDSSKEPQKRDFCEGYA